MSDLPMLDTSAFLTRATSPFPKKFIAYIVSAGEINEKAPDIQAQLKSKATDSTIDSAIVRSDKNISKLEARQALIAKCGTYDAEEWRKVDQHRDNLRSDLTLILLSPESAEKMNQHAPNFRSVLGADVWSAPQASSGKNLEELPLSLTKAIAEASESKFSELYEEGDQTISLLDASGKIIQILAEQQNGALGHRRLGFLAHAMLMEALPTIKNYNMSFSKMQRRSWNGSTSGYIPMTSLRIYRKLNRKSSPPRR